MKIRSDYVSNSSSSSFIITFNDGGKCIDEKFIRLLKRTKYVSISGNCETDEQYGELKAKVIEVFGDKSISTWPADELSLNVDIKEGKLDSNNPKQIEVIRELLKLKNVSFYCGCGDDWGYDLANAVQIATILECSYKDIEIEGDDHLDYNSIRGTELDCIG